LPMKESFYEHFGFVPFCQWREVTAQLGQLSKIFNHKPEGTVERLELKSNYDIYDKLLKKTQLGIHGMMILPKHVRLAGREIHGYCLAVARDKNCQVIGAMVYQLKGKRRPTLFWVKEFHYVNEQGKYLLLYWMAVHKDRQLTIRLPVAPFEVAENWLTDFQIRLSSDPEYEHSPMGRVVSVEKLSGIKLGIPCSEEFGITVSIQDTLCHWNHKTFHFSADQGNLRVVPSETAPEVTITINALSALVYGTCDPTSFVYLGWAPKLDEAVSNKLRRLFPRPAHLPYLYSKF